MDLPDHIRRKITSGVLTREEIFVRLRFWHGQGCDIQPYLHLVEPTAWEKIVNFTKAISEAAVHELTEGDTLVPAEVAEERLAICKACPFFNNGTCSHPKCGCTMRRKVKLSTAYCPDTPRKWDVYVPS